MVLGLKFGQKSSEGNEAKELTYKKVQQFITAFKSRFDSLNCRELIGFDLSDPAQRKKANQGDEIHLICTNLVVTSVSLLEELLGNNH